MAVRADRDQISHRVQLAHAGGHELQVVHVTVIASDSPVDTTEVKAKDRAGLPVSVLATMDGASTPLVPRRQVRNRRPFGERLSWAGLGCSARCGLMVGPPFPFERTGDWRGEEDTGRLMVPKARSRCSALQLGQ